jgi:hypothetical protein
MILPTLNQNSHGLFQETIINTIYYQWQIDFQCLGSKTPEDWLAKWKETQAWFQKRLSCELCPCYSKATWFLVNSLSRGLGLFYSEELQEANEMVQSSWHNLRHWINVPSPPIRHFTYSLLTHKNNLVFRNRVPGHCFQFSSWII